MGDEQIIASGEVTAPKQLPAKARLNQVTGIAGTRLLSLSEQDLFMPNEKGSEIAEFVSDLRQVLSRDRRAVTSKLDNRPVERHPPVKSRCCVKSAVAADHCGFDYLTGPHDNHKRDNSRMGKVNGADGLSRLA